MIIVHTVVYLYPLTSYFIAKNRVWVWGDNSEGQLGLGDSLSEVDKPTRLKIDEKPVHISCGYYHTAIVTGKFTRSNCFLSL